MPKFHPLHSNFQCLSSMSAALSKMASPTAVHVCTSDACSDQHGCMGPAGAAALGSSATEGFWRR